MTPTSTPSLLFADNVRSSCLSPDDAPLVTRALESFAFRLDQGDARGAAVDLATLADRLIDAADHLLRGPVENAALIAECRPWIEAFEIGALAMRRIAELAAERPARARRADGPASVPRPASERPGASVRQRARQDPGRPHRHPRPAGVADAGRAATRGLTT